MFASSMVRMSGMAALGMAVSLTSLATTAQAQPDPASRGTSVYSPPAPSHDIYHPAPIRPYVPSFSSAYPSSSAPMSTDTTRPVIYETEDWFQKKDNRWMIFGIASLIVLLTTAGIFHVINRHKDELDGGGKS